jgi:hypothetical protein
MQLEGFCVSLSGCEKWKKKKNMQPVNTEQMCDLVCFYVPAFVCLIAIGISGCCVYVTTLERILSVFIRQITFSNQAYKKSPKAEGLSP